jgi:hypothetical protein
MKMKAAKPFLNIPEEVDLSFIKGRLEGIFYRREDALVQDIERLGGELTLWENRNVASDLELVRFLCLRMARLDSKI